MTRPADPLESMFHDVRDATFPAGDLATVDRRAARIRRRGRVALAAATGCAVLAVVGLTQVIDPTGGTRALLPAVDRTGTPTTTRALGTASPPPGFLRLADLGHRDWQLDATTADHLPATGSEHVPLPGCSPKEQEEKAPAQAVAYRRPLQRAHGEWILAESTMALDAAPSARVEAAMRTLLTCPGVMWEEDQGATVLLVVWDDPPDMSARPVQAWALTGRTLLTLTLFWAGTDQPAPTYDGTPMKQLIALAVQRHSTG